MTKQEFLKRARETHGYKYEYPNLTDKVLSNQDIDVLYEGVLYKQKVVKHILLGRCPEKNTPKTSQEEFIRKCKELWGEKYDYSLTKYTGANNKIKIIYEGVIYEQVAQSHISGLTPDAHMNQEAFIKKAKEKWGKNKYDYSMVEYEHCKAKVKIIYNGVTYEQTPAQHLNCAPENIKLSIRKTTEQFITEGNQVHDFKYSYDKTNYIKNQIKVIITCPIHGDFEQNPLSHIQGCGCPYCNESLGEREITRILKSYNINFDRQKKFPDCKNVLELPFDFYIPSMRIAIEYDGKQHYEPLSFFGGQEAFEKLKQNDKIKNDYCEDNYINLIRIKYDDIDNIERILNKSIIAYRK
jgi:very-short-patch-repair endonuclease